ncbi:MAG: type 4 pilus major pilin [Alphaproteobacteria bacterium]|nr:type 4 pilus major pilin [Alphaproteobacteria bacterium]
MTRSLRRRFSQGFSLLEAVLVLGIMGLVLGGVFALIPTVRGQMNLNEAIEDLNMIVNNVHTYYAARAYPSGLKACNGNFNNYDDISGKGIFPSSMEVTSGVETYVHNPLSPVLTETTAEVKLCGSDPVRFIVRYKNVPKSACVSVVKKTGVEQKDAGLYLVFVNGNWLGTTLSGVVFVCSEENNDIDWYYNLSRL